MVGALTKKHGGAGHASHRTLHVGRVIAPPDYLTPKASSKAQMFPAATPKVVNITSTRRADHRCPLHFMTWTFQGGRNPDFYYLAHVMLPGGSRIVCMI